MDISLILKIAGIGMLVSVASQILSKSGRDEQAMMVTIAGIIAALMLIISQIGELFDMLVSIYCSHNISAHRARRIAVPAMVHRRNDSLLHTVNMTKSTIKSYTPSLLGNPSSTKLANCIIVRNIRICQFYCFIRHFCQASFIRLILSFVDSIQNTYCIGDYLVNFFSNLFYRHWYNFVERTVSNDAGKYFPEHDDEPFRINCVTKFHANLQSLSHVFCLFVYSTSRYTHH